MSTTQEQKNLIVRAIGEHMRSHGHKVNYEEYKGGPQSTLMMYSSNNPNGRIVLISSELKGQKWMCTYGRVGFSINLAEPDSLKRLEVILLCCASYVKVARTNTCRKCPAGRK